MVLKGPIGAMAMAVMLCVTLGGARAFDEATYPDMQGQWRHPDGAGNNWDPTKPRGRAQQAPLTPEYQAIFEANLADQEAGGMGTDPTYTCIPDGMPRAMNVIFPMQIVITPQTTFMMIEYLSMLRRIYTDGRKFPDDFEPSFMGYSIGNWTDMDGQGRYTTLEIETRLLKGPRAFDASGAPLHKDNQTIVKERLYLDKNNPNILRDDITTIDHALTRPWTVNKTYDRVRNPVWVESICSENNPHVTVGGQPYMLGADDELMPSKKGQKPPSLKHFEDNGK